jgi:two-component system NtrC family sensor kinase
MTEDASILIVDDEPNVLKALRRLFIDTDYRILTAESGARGLEICREEDVHVVISDYRMPEMNGVEFLSRVREESPDTIRMILSGFADATAVVDAINDGQVYKFLAKPWNDQDILSTVKRAIEHYGLQLENNKLLQELRKTNSELRTLTEGLERKVTERTHDLQLQHRALEVVRSMVDLLPAGILGVDSNQTIVYMNDIFDSFASVTGGGLGCPADEVLDEFTLEAVQEALETNKVVTRNIEGHEGLGMICRPLPKGGGVVVLLGYVDPERSAAVLADRAECGC